jgi:hypothetical protein
MLPTCISLSILALALGLEGRRRWEAAERKIPEAPPASVASPNELHICPDLFALFTFQRVPTDDSKATVRYRC